MFYVFIDFEKAFDTVWGEDLRCKLLMNHINGKMYIVIVNMYHNVKSRITYDNAFSELLWERRQTRKILFPFLFSLYLNDLETFLENNNVTGLKLYLMN